MEKFIPYEKLSKKGSDTTAAGAKILRFDADACKIILSSLQDQLCASYFMKMSFTRIFNHVDNPAEVEVPQEIIDAAVILDANLTENETSITETKGLLLQWRTSGFVKEHDYRNLCHQIDNIQELITKISEYPWHPTILRLLESNQA